MTRDWLELKFAYSLCSSLFYLIRVKLDKISYLNRKSSKELNRNTSKMSNSYQMLSEIVALLRDSHVWLECPFTSVMKIVDIFRKIKSVRTRNAYQLLGTKAKMFDIPKLFIYIYVSKIKATFEINFGQC